MALFNKTTELTKQDYTNPEARIKLSGLKRAGALAAGYDKYGNRLKGAGFVQGLTAAAAVGLAPFTGGTSLALLGINGVMMGGQRIAENAFEGTKKEESIDKFHGSVLQNTAIGAAIGGAAGVGASMLGVGAGTTAATTGAGTTAVTTGATTGATTATGNVAGATTTVTSGIGTGVEAVTQPTTSALANSVPTTTTPTIPTEVPKIDIPKPSLAKVQADNLLQKNINNILSKSETALGKDYQNALKIKPVDMSITDFNKDWYKKSGKELLKNEVKKEAVDQGIKFAKTQLESALKESLYREEDNSLNEKQIAMGNYENNIIFKSGGKIPNSAPSHKDGGVKVVNKKGKWIAEVEGGEEVFSVTDTKKMEELARKNDLSLLGKFVKQTLTKHKNNSSPQYAAVGTNNLGLDEMDLLAKNDSIKNLQKIIFKIEAGRAGYDSVVKTNGDFDLTKMTYAEARKKHGNKAIGAYQIIGSTGDEAIKALGEDPNTFVLTKENQDKLFYYLLKKRGAIDFVQGKITEDKFIENLSAEWAAIPKNESNKSYYEGDQYGNKALVSHDIMKKALQADRPLTQEEINQNINENLKTNPQGEEYSKQYNRYQEATKRGSNYSAKELDEFDAFIRKVSDQKYIESKQDSQYKLNKSNRDLLLKQIEAKNKGENISYKKEWENDNLNELTTKLKTYNKWLLEKDQKISGEIKFESDKYSNKAKTVLQNQLAKGKITTDDFTLNSQKIIELTQPINNNYKSLTINNLAAQGKLNDIKKGDMNKTPQQKELEQNLTSLGYWDDPNKYIFKQDQINKNLLSYQPIKPFDIKVDKNAPILKDDNYVAETEILKWKNYETEVSTTLAKDRKKQYEDLMSTPTQEVEYDVISDIDPETKAKTNDLTNLMSDDQVKGLLKERDEVRQNSGLGDVFKKLGGWSSALDMTGMALAYNEANKPLPQQKKSAEWIAQTDILKARQKFGLSEEEKTLFQRQSERTYATNVALIGRYGTSGQAVLGSLQGAVEKKYDADLALTAMDAKQRNQNVTDYSNWLSKDESYTQQIWNQNVFEPKAKAQALKAGLIGAAAGKLKENISYYKNYEDPSSLYQKLMNQELRNKESADKMYNISLIKNMGGTDEQISKVQSQLDAEKASVQNNIKK